MSRLPKVIQVDKDKCVNCHACISVCPIKFCNNGSGEYIELNHDMCIACGQCLDVCTHEARVFKDDLNLFIEALQSKLPMVAIVAPSIASNFPKEYLHINGWLKSIGVEAIFDVSFGAELTVKSYIEYIKSHSPKTVIAQPCPAIVTYIQIYHPELIPYLAPADSPMLHTIKLIRRYYKKYHNHKILVLSPCLAKKREFEATGLGDFNVSYLSLENYFSLQNINLSTYPEVDYDSPLPERAVLFSTPGGLLETAKREVPGIENKTRKIEGPTIIYPYLDQLKEMISQNKAPLLIDCLNCERGCNGGTGTKMKHLSPDELEYRINQRKEKVIEQQKATSFFQKFKPSLISQSISAHWKPGLYDRSYNMLKHNITIHKPSPKELEIIYNKMEKFQNEDILNCGACGYRSCEEMAIAIHNQLNRPDNCFKYREKLLSTQKIKLDSTIEEISTNHKQDMDIAREFAASISEANHAIKDILEKTEHLYKSSVEQKTFIESYSKDLQSILVNIDELHDIVKAVNKISEETHLVALNAAIEAASAGVYGRSFSVVADEIKHLALKTQERVEKISPMANDLKGFFKKYEATFDKLSTLSGQTSSLSKDVRRSNQQIELVLKQILEESRKLDRTQSSY